MLYFDNAATSYPKPQAVIDACNQAFLSAGNPGRGAHSMALWSSRMIYSARESVARLFHADIDQVLFTANATMALNEAINQVDGPVVTTAMEHNSVLRPCHARGNYKIVPAPDGELKISEIEKAIDKYTKAVIMTHASNLTGEIYDIAAVGKICREQDLIFIVDAAQTAGVVPIDVKAMNIDMLAFAGHKGTMGPTGTGGLIIGERVKARPFMTGGTGSKSHELNHPLMMPDVLEAGTINIHGIAGLQAGIEFVQKAGIDKILAHEQSLAKRFIEGITDIKGIRVYRPDCTRAGTVAVNFEDMDASEVCDWLAERDICVRGGAHCAPLAHDALGTGGRGAVRFSFGYFNTPDEIEQTVKLLKDLAN